jgi:hypothetical protein
MANFSLVQPDFLKYYLIPLEFSLQLQIDSLKRISSDHLLAGKGR